MKPENLNVYLPEGIDRAEVVIREGDAAKVLDPKPPVKTNIEGVLNAPFEYLSKRLNAEPVQFDQKRCHVLVDREHLSIKLIINDHDEYTRGFVQGRLEQNAKFLEFGINTGKVWTPTELGLFIKMNRSFFTDKAAAMSLTTELMNFKATVDAKLERSLQETGSKTDNFSQVVNSNIPASFKINIQIFKGHPVEELEVETFAQIDGRNVAFILISPGANDSLEATRDRAIDYEIEAIKELAPDIAIIEQ